MAKVTLTSIIRNEITGSNLSDGWFFVANVQFNLEVGGYFEDFRKIRNILNYLTRRGELIKSGAAYKSTMLARGKLEPDEIRMIRSFVG